MKSEDSLLSFIILQKIIEILNGKHIFNNSKNKIYYLFNKLKQKK